MPAPTAPATLLHNPHCSKSRAAKALLEERGIAFDVRLYLEEPLSRAELDELRERLGRPAREWVRAAEPAFAACGLTMESHERALLDAIAAHPELLERPILVAGERATIGRPPERVLALVE